MAAATALAEVAAAMDVVMIVAYGLSSSYYSVAEILSVVAMALAAVAAVAILAASFDYSVLAFAGALIFCFST